MAKGRPQNPDTQYKIIIHAIRGLRYASTKIYKESKSGKINHCYIHWGRLMEGDKFHPGCHYLYASSEERRKLIFPKDWDLSEIEKLEGSRKQGRVSYEKDDVDRQYGATWFLDHVSEVTGLHSDLMKVFGSNGEMVNDILTLAYFPFVDNLSYSHLKQWQREVKAPSNRELTSKVITTLTRRITEQNRMDLFRYRAHRVDKDELCAVDSTSISSYGFNLVDIRWGKNKEKLPLRQTLEVVVYSLTSHQPIYYKELPGNMPDCRSVELILKELKDAGFKNLILITDRGYESMRNLENFIAKGQKIITSIRVSGSEVLEKIRSIDLSHGYPTNMELACEEDIYYAQFDMPYDISGNGESTIHAKHSKLNLYFNIKNRAEEIVCIQRAIQEQQEVAKVLVDLATPIHDTSDINQRLRFLKLTFDDHNRLIGWVVNQDVIDRRMLIAGFFASRSLGFECHAMQAKDNYTMRDEQEKTFSLQKGLLGKDRLRAWSETGRHGRMFICFIALILASYVRKIYSQNKWLQNQYDSIEDVLAEMRTIRCIEHNGRSKFITPFVGNQLKICEIFGFEVPEGCGKVYQSKRIGSTKRGRKAKPKIEKEDI